jgi:nucleotide-binding universal stress UspA family protein
MKTILIPTDFSDNSSNAISYGLQLFKHEDVNFVFLHVSHPIVDLPTSSIEYFEPVIFEDQEEVKKQIQNQLTKICQKENVDLNKINYQIECLVGFAGDLIVSKAKEAACDLIVMGTKGASGLDQILLGSITASVIRKSTISVIAVPENYSFKKLEKIVFATDYEGISNKKTLLPLFDFASKFQSKVLMFHAIEAKEPIAAYIEELQVWKAEKNFEHVKHSNSIASCENIPDGILDFAGENEADMIALIPHTYSFFGNLLHKSVSKQVAFESNIPILALH